MLATLHQVAVPVLALLAPFIIQFLVCIVEPRHVFIIRLHLVLALIVHVGTCAIVNIMLLRHIGRWRVLGVWRAIGHYLWWVLVHGVEVAIVECVGGWHWTVGLLGAVVHGVGTAVESRALA